MDLVRLQGLPDDLSVVLCFAFRCGNVNLNEDGFFRLEHRFSDYGVTFQNRT